MSYKSYRGEREKNFVHLALYISLCLRSIAAGALPLPAKLRPIGVRALSPLCSGIKRSLPSPSSVVSLFCVGRSPSPSSPLLFSSPLLSLPFPSWPPPRAFHATAFGSPCGPPAPCRALPDFGSHSTLPRPVVPTVAMPARSPLHHDPLVGRWRVGRCGPPLFFSVSCPRDFSSADPSISVSLACPPAPLDDRNVFNPRASRDA